jgi:putative nucleotidyltransferase with HDIG domain
MLTATLLSSLLFSRRTGLLLSLFFAVYYLLISQFSVIVPLSVLLIGGFVSHFAQKIRYRRHLLWLIVSMIAANILIQFLIMFLSNTLSTQSLFTFFAAPCLNVIISAGIVYLALPLFEYMFGITTIMTLLELADLSNPLLKRLAMEAPGTFNHSLAVGNLAELAAEKVGANPILCRVLAYYHDVGKIKNPVFFTENQLDNRNPHDKLTPLRSAKILTSHIGDGLDLIEEYKLPKIIRNGIFQHHGTGFAGFFYEKALEAKKEDEVINPEDFRYAGEKPQTKETAILMLADKVEAMSKSLKGESEADLRKKIYDNVRKIVVSGQLDECGLTFRNVFEIINGFMPALKGIFHERIEYPNEEDKNGKKQV